MSKYSADLKRSQGKYGFVTRITVMTVCLIVAIWLLDPLIGSAFFTDAGYISGLLDPSPIVFYFRSLLSLLVLVAGYTYYRKVHHIREQNQQLEQQKKMIQQIIDSEPECVKTVARDGKLLDMNPAGLNIVEATSIDQVRYGSVYDLIAPEDREAYIAFNHRVFQGEQACMEYDVLGLDGSRKSVESHAVPLRSEGGEIIAHLAITRDITQFKESQKELQKFSLAVEQCASMVMITDPKGVLSYVNPRFCAVTGFSAEECIGQTPKLLYSGKHSDEFYEQMWQQIGSGQEWRGNVQNRRKNGELYWAAIIISPIKNDSGDITQYLCTQEDITDSHLLKEQLEYQAKHCMLTGLVNRHEFEQQLEITLQQAQIQSQEHPTQHTILFSDIDQFKLINDTCGHAAGDQLLRQISTLLQHCVRQSDLVSRLGGDEFAVLIRHCDSDKVAQIVEHIRQTVEDFSFLWEKQSFKITISIGWLILDELSPDSATVLSQVDAACYTAKELGRNRSYHHQDSEQDRIRFGEYQWVNRIHEGLENNNFKLYVQEIKALQRDEDSHYEVLLRYIDDTGQVIPPGAFLPPAERYGISPKIDRWVIRQVCHFLTTELSEDISLSVNLSGLSVNDAGFLEYVQNILQEYGVAPERICFEITETATISNLSEAVVFIKKMKAIGCRFSLDDFGSGLSSFGYLKTLPVDYVKIDGIFVKHICSDPIDRAMVKSINEIGQLMGKETVAEFVEDDASEQLLRELGVNYAQGYGVSRPQPIDQLFSAKSL